MAFITKEWKDRLVEFAGRRKLTNVATGEETIVDVARNEGAVSQEGDAFSATNMNGLEQRIKNEFDSVNSNLSDLSSSFNSMEVNLQSVKVSSNLGNIQYIGNITKGEVLSLDLTDKKGVLLYMMASGEEGYNFSDIKFFPKAFIEHMTAFDSRFYMTIRVFSHLVNTIGILNVNNISCSEIYSNDGIMTFVALSVFYVF